MRKALVLVFNNLKHDARVNRQINFLSKHFQLTVLAFGGDDRPGVNLIRTKQSPLTLFTKIKMAFWLGLRFYKKAYLEFHSYETVTQALSGTVWDLIVANDIDTLPMAIKIKGTNSSKIIFDAHEYAPRHFENRLIWKIFMQPFYVHLCKKYIPLVDEMLTVGVGLADEYEKHFNRRPIVITNSPPYFDIQASLPESNKIKMVHHGIANPSRKLELLFDLMQNLDERFTLDLILLTSDYASGSTKHYIENLKSKFLTDTRIKILPAVKSDEVVKTINQYDLGLFLLPPVNFNYENALPNKLFDFIQARLAIGIGPSKEMAAVVNHFKLGVISPTFDPKDLAIELSRITIQQLIEYKANAGVAAKELNAEKNDEIMLRTINKIFC